MTSCDDINKRLADLEAREKAILEQKAKLEGEEGAATAGKGKRVLIPKDFAGRQMGVNTGEWIKQAFADMKFRSDETIQELVDLQGPKGRGPVGSSGRMVNGRQIYDVDYTNRAIAKDRELLMATAELLGVRRLETKDGQTLRSVMKESDALSKLAIYASNFGGDAVGLMRNLKARTRGINKMPQTVLLVAKARWDSISQYADMLDELSEAMDGGTLTPELQMRAGISAQNAVLFEQLDALVRRRVGQSLKSLQFNIYDDGIQLVDGKDLPKELKWADINGESLLGQVNKAVAAGDPLKLKRMAMAVRSKQMRRVELNGRDGSFMSSLGMLNQMRRMSLLTSPRTWGYRNPIGGLSMIAWTGIRDVTASYWRMGGDTGRVAQAVSYANSHLINEFGTVWKLTSDYFKAGRSTLIEDDVARRMSGAAGTELTDKEVVYAQLEETLQSLRSDWQPGIGLADKLARTTPDMVALLGHANAILFGKVFEKTTGWTGGYMLPYRLLGTGDEFVRAVAKSLGEGLEGYVQAVQKYGDVVDEGLGRKYNPQEIAELADYEIEKSTFGGMLSDDDLVNFRRENGIPAGEGLSNDDLRFQLYAIKDGPVPGTAIGDKSRELMREVTFGQKIKDPVLQAIGMARQNSIVAWQLQFYQVPLNSTLFNLTDNLPVNAYKWFGIEWSDASIDEKAFARARLIQSAAFFSVVAGMFANGKLTGGGPRDKEEYKRWRRNNTPYSFQIGGGLLPAARFQNVKGIDVMDLAFLYADILELSGKPLMKGDLGEATIGLSVAMARLLNNKASLLNMSTMLNAFVSPERSDMANVLRSQLGGIIPNAGIANWASDIAEPIGRQYEARRFLSEDELKAVNGDSIWDVLEPARQILAEAGGALIDPYGFTPPNYVDEDWLGSKIERPFGVPLEALVPFSPVIQPQDPLYQWLEEHGVTSKPRASGNVKASVGMVEGDDPDLEGRVLPMTMLHDEEKIYRAAMKDTPGDASAEDILPGRVFQIPDTQNKVPVSFIDQFVKGRTMPDALRALSKNETFMDAFTADPASGLSASATVADGNWVERKRTLTGQMIQAILDYYDYYGMQGLRTSDAPAAQEWRARRTKMIEYKRQALIDQANALDVFTGSRQ